MSHPSKRKGTGGERELVQTLIAQGVRARRVPLSGSVAGYPGDVIVGEGDQEQTWEVKRRAGAFRLIYRWLQDAEVIAFRGDREEWLVCLRLDDLLDAASPKSPLRNDPTRWPFTGDVVRVVDPDKPARTEEAFVEQRLRELVPPGTKDPK